jgi:hypothetical protein
MNRPSFASSLLTLFVSAVPLAGCLAGSEGEPSPTDSDKPGPAQVLPSGFALDPERSLLVRTPYITDDFTRTLDPCRERDVKKTAAGDVTSSQTWTFGYLMKQIANGRDPSVFAHNWLANWKLSTTVNGDPLVAHKNGDGTTLPGRIYDAWQRASGGTAGTTVKLAMNRAPFRLLAIVNRFDLRKDKQRFGVGNPSNPGNAGELRFVFSVLDLDQVEPSSGCQQAKGDAANSKPGDDLLILEYSVNLANATAVNNWISSWVNLTNYAAPDDPGFAPALQALTQQIVAAGAGGTRQNGSALIRLRTNESADGTTWDLREFTLNSSGYLFPTTVKQTPTFASQNNAALSQWINDGANRAAILGDSYVLPATYLGAHAENLVNSFSWRFTGVDDTSVRHAVALGTCNGCHGLETGNSANFGDGNGFSHIKGRTLGQPSMLSPFLEGTPEGYPFCPYGAFPGADGSICFKELQTRTDDIFSYFTTGQ